MNGILPKIKQRLRWKRYGLQFALGMGKPLLQNRPGCRFLNYHGIDNSGRTDINSRFSSAKSLEHHLAWFKRNCEVLDVAQYFRPQDIQGGLKIALSFDDGYLNNLRFALPLLEKYQVPAVFYVTASPSQAYPILWCDLFDLLRFLQPDTLRAWAESNGLPASFPELHRAIRTGGPKTIRLFLDNCIPKAKFMQDPAWDTHWKLLQATDIRPLAQHPLITIGSHSVLHSDLTCMDLEMALEECAQAKAWLEECTGQPVLDFAFPFGHYSNELAAALLHAGHERLACLEFGAGPAPQNALPRMGMNPHIADNVQIVEILRGSYY